VSVSQPEASLEKATGRERRMQRGRRELALVALRHYERKGFAQSSVEDIASEADYAASSFYRHFGTKENAVFFDIDERLETYRALIQDPPAPGTGWAKVRELLLDNALYWQDSDPEFGELRARLCHREPALFHRYLEYCAQVEEIVLRIIAEDRHTVPSDDIVAGVLAGGAVAAWRTAMRVWLAKGGKLTAHMSAALDAVEAGLPSSGF
jgi:AcrR family transcriptional regulator